MKKAKENKTVFEKIGFNAGEVEEMLGQLSKEEIIEWQEDLDQISKDWCIRDILRMVSSGDFELALTESKPSKVIKLGVMIQDMCEGVK